MNPLISCQVFSYSNIFC